MAESQANHTTSEPPPAQKDGGEKQLKYLGFVETLVIYFIVCSSTVYGYAKENAGRFKPNIQTAENMVITVIGPIYEKFQDVPLVVLMFLDVKVGEALAALHRHAPTVINQVSTHAKYAGQNLPGVAKNLASEAFKSTTKVTKALYVKYEPTAKELYKTYEPVAEKYAVYAWRSMHKLPLFPQVAQVAVPIAAFLLEKYNCTVIYTADKGYQVAQYLPLVPLEKIAKVFADGENESTASQSGQSGQSNQVKT